MANLWDNTLLRALSSGTRVKWRLFKTYLGEFGAHQDEEAESEDLAGRLHLVPVLSHVDSLFLATEFSSSSRPLRPVIVLAALSTKT